MSTKARFEHYDLLICTCCLLRTANGECDCGHCLPADLRNVCLGGDAEGEFRSRSCDTCHTPLAGDRHQAVRLVKVAS